MIWASTYLTNLRHIVTLQKRVIRIVSKSKFDDHTSPIFKSLGIIKFLYIRSIQLGQFGGVALLYRKIFRIKKTVHWDKIELQII